MARRALRPLGSTSTAVRIAFSARPSSRLVRGGRRTRDLGRVLERRAAQKHLRRGQWVLAAVVLEVALKAVQQRAGRLGVNAA